MKSDALLVLEDGTVFHGVSIGIKSVVVGELIFNTAHVGYQEALTDPSYASQLIVFTSPHIGNVGCNAEDEESTCFWAAGLILREQPTAPSSWRSQTSLHEYLESHQIVGIAEIDTRALTRLLRKRGHLSACIVTNGLDVDQAKDLATSFHEVRSPYLLEKVSTLIPYNWEGNLKSCSQWEPVLHLVVYDFGVKHNILRLLATLGYKVTIVPFSTPLSKIQALHPDGIVLSNGPGDPAVYTEALSIVKLLIMTDLPILGICLGHQLLGLASGAHIMKLKFGHHGINHPLRDMNTGQVFISSQNHNFAIADDDFPQDLEVSHRSLFDFSIQGIRHKYKPIFGIQGHPEGCPGPLDIFTLLDPFLAAVASHSHKKMTG